MGPASAPGHGPQRPAPRGTAAYPRKRAVKACQVCRARRTKCDNLKPSCSFCLKVGATCIQSPVDFSSFDPASLKILDRLDDLEEILRSGVAAAGSNGKTLQASEPPCPIDASPSGPKPIAVLPPSQADVIGWLRRVTHSRTPQTQRVVPPRRAPFAQPQVSALTADDTEPRRVLDLLDCFFRFVHVKNPILDERATRQMVQLTFMNGVDWTAESCLSLLICALGALASPFGPSDDKSPGTAAYVSAQSFFHAAQKRLGVLFVSNDIIGPQCFFLAGVFLMCMLQEAQAWRCFVQALAGCQKIGPLNDRLPERSSPDSRRDSESESSITPQTHYQAIYWSAWKSEREIRKEHCLADFPLGDSELGLYPGYLPTPPVVPADHEVPADLQWQREQSSWYFYLAEISLRRLSARVSTEMTMYYAAQPSPRAFLHKMLSAMPSFEAQAEEWIRSLPQHLSFDLPAEEDDVCRFVLRCHIIDYYEMIYWPFIYAYLDDPANDSPWSAELNAPTEQGLKHHLMRLFVNERGYRHRHHGTIPMLRSCSRSALILSAASRRSTTDNDRRVVMPEDWAQGVIGVSDLLEFWKNETSDFTEPQEFLRMLNMDFATYTAEH